MSCEVVTRTSKVKIYVNIFSWKWMSGKCSYFYRLVRQWKCHTVPFEPWGETLFLAPPPPLQGGQRSVSATERHPHPPDEEWASLLMFAWVRTKSTRAWAALRGAVSEEKCSRSWMWVNQNGVTSSLDVRLHKYNSDGELQWRLTSSKCQKRRAQLYDFICCTGSCCVGTDDGWITS